MKENHNKYGIGWDEIFEICVCQIDGITEIYWYLDINFEWGEYIEVYSDYSNFVNLIPEIAERFNLPVDWFEAVKSLNQQSFSIWKKAVE